MIAIHNKPLKSPQFAFGGKRSCLTPSSKTRFSQNTSLLFWAIALFAHMMASPAAISKELSVSESAQAEIPDTLWPRLYFPRFDRVAASAGVEPLRTKDLPEGTREVRIWISGPGDGHNLYRVVETEASVFGELIFSWSARAHESDLPGQSMHDLAVYNLTGSCYGFFKTETTATCRALFDQPPDWEGILRAAELAGLWRLPDLSELPVERLISTGGWGLTVELREGKAYRAYQYNNPASYPSSPEAVQALEIAELFRNIQDLVRPADVEGTYRGITTGQPGAAFFFCNSDNVWGIRFALQDLAYLADLNLPDPGAFGYVVTLVGKPAPEWLAREMKSNFSQVLPWAEIKSIEPAHSPSCD